MEDHYSLSIGEGNIISEQNVTLLGRYIGNRLSFDEHISDLCKKQLTN